MLVKALVLDVGGVLVESPFMSAIRWAERWKLPMEAFGAIFGEYTRAVAPGETPPLWHEVECGRVPLDDFVVHMRERLDEHLEPAHPARELVAADFNPFAGAAGHPQVAQLARDAAAAGYATAILTNNVREWGSWRDIVPLDAFDHVIDSSEVGLRKPDPAIYELTSDRLGVSNTEVLFLDDHQGNLEAAAAQGWRVQLVEADVDPAVSAARSLLGLEDDIRG